MALLDELTPAPVFDFPIPDAALPNSNTPYVQDNLDILKLYRAIQESKKTPLAKQAQQKAKEREAAKKQTGEQYWAAAKGQRMVNDPVANVLPQNAVPAALALQFGADPYDGMNDDGFLQSKPPQHGGAPEGGLYGGLDAPETPQRVAPISPQQQAAVIAALQQAAPNAPVYPNAYDDRLNPFGVGSGYEELQRPRVIK